MPVWFVWGALLDFFANTLGFLGCTHSTLHLFSVQYFESNLIKLVVRSDLIRSILSCWNWSCVGGIDDSAKP
jgi:hypothetical protein